MDRYDTMGHAGQPPSVGAAMWVNAIVKMLFTLLHWTVIKFSFVTRW